MIYGNYLQIHAGILRLADCAIGEIYGQKRKKYEAGSQKLEVRSRKSEVRGQR